MTARIFRYEVPVDGQPHTIALHADPLGVGCRRLGSIEFWAVHDDMGTGSDRTFTVVGTGHPLPANYLRHWGHAVDGGSSLIWHLIEVAS